MCHCRGCHIWQPRPTLTRSNGLMPVVKSAVYLAGVPAHERSLLFASAGVSRAMAIRLIPIAAMQRPRMASPLLST